MVTPGSVLRDLPGGTQRTIGDARDPAQINWTASGFPYNIALSDSDQYFKGKILFFIKTLHRLLFLISPKQRFGLENIYLRKCLILTVNTNYSSV